LSIPGLLTSAELIYDFSRRDLVLQSPVNDRISRGTLHLRSPARPNPNPIGTAIAHLVGIEGAITMVRGLDCFDGIRRLDLKPDRGLLRLSRRRSPAILKSAIPDFVPRGSAFQNAFRV
jgi:tRNA (Thr-GGU) A37 N-methylase